MNYPDSNILHSYDIQFNFCGFYTCDKNKYINGCEVT